MATTDSLEIPLGGLKQQLKEATKQVQELSEKFGATSKQAIEAAKSAAILKDKIGDAKALTDAFNPDAKFKAVTSSLAGVAGGFSALQGAIGLFGTESKDVEKALLKVQSAMALSQGLQAVGESIDSFKNLGAVLKGIPIIQNAITFAQRLWNAAMAANPIGAVVAVVAALVAGITALVMWMKRSSDAAKEQTKSVTEFTKELKRQKEVMEDSNTTFERDQKHRLAMAKASGMSAEAIRQLERKLIDEKIAFAEASAQTAFNTLEKQKNYLATLKSADAEEELIKKQQENVDKAREQLTTANADVKKAGNERLDIINRQKEEIVQNQTDTNKKRLESQKEYNDKAKEKLKAAGEELKKIELELTKINLDAKGKELKDLEVNYQKSKEILIAGKKSTAELDELYRRQKEEVNKKYDKEELKKAEEFQEAINEIKNKTAALGIVDKREQEIQAINDAYAKELKAIEANENYNAEQKLALKLLKEDEQQAALKKKRKEFGDEDATKIVESGIADIDKISNATKISLEDRKTAIIGSTKDLLDNFKGTADQRLQIESASAQAINKVDDEISKEKVARKKSEVDAISGALDVLGGIVDKGSIAGKGIAIAQAVMNTYQAATAALAASPPPFNFIAAAASVAAGLVNVSKIVSTKVPSAKGTGSIGGGSAPSISSAAAPLTAQRPQAQMTQLNQESINAIGNQAIKAYVVETDMTTNQQRVAAIQQRARFG